jgi:hypothetical protein
MTAARVRSCNHSCWAAFDLQLIINQKLRPFPHVTDRPDEHPFPVLFGLTVRRTAVIEPPGGIPTLSAINHTTIVKAEEEGMAILDARTRMNSSRVLARNELAFVFENQHPGRDIGKREHAAAMYGRIANDDTTHDCIE